MKIRLIAALFIIMNLLSACATQPTTSSLQTTDSGTTIDLPPPTPDTTINQQNNAQSIVGKMISH